MLIHKLFGIYPSVLVSSFQRGVQLHTDVFSFQGVGIEEFHCIQVFSLEFHCIQRCPHSRGLG